MEMEKVRREAFVRLTVTYEKAENHMGTRQRSTSMSTKLYQRLVLVSGGTATV